MIPVTGPSIRVLVADADQAFRESLGLALQEAGFKVSIADDAKAVFVAGREHRIHFILLDLDLPGLNIEWFMRLLRDGAMMPHAHVMTMARIADPDMLAQGCELGVSIHFRKADVNAALLANAINELESVSPPEVPALDYQTRGSSVVMCA
jgi:DNA-binding response OmpR family regulator